MRFTILLLAALAVVCTAQSLLTALPSCAVSCASESLSQSTCAITDVNCMCSDKNFLQLSEACIAVECDVRDVLIAKNATMVGCNLHSRDDSSIIATFAPAITAVSLAFIVIRLMARWAMLGWDDGLMVLAWLTGLVCSVLNVIMTHYGLGKDIWTVPVDDISYMLYLYYISEPLYLAATMFTKIGLCWFLMKIFPYRSFATAMWAIIGISGSAWVSFTLALAFQCTPIRYSWLFYLSEMKGKCINRNAATWAHAAVNIVLDLIILALPLIQLYWLQTSYSTRKKIQIMFMFSVGIIVTIVSGLRLKSLIAFMESRNLTYDNLSTSEWSIAEMHVGIICACLPSARIFFGRILPKLLGVTSAESRRGTPAAYMAPAGRSGQPPKSWNRVSTTLATFNDDRKEATDNKDFMRLQDIEGNRRTTITEPDRSHNPFG